MHPHLPRISAGDTTATIDLEGGRVAAFRVAGDPILFTPSAPVPEHGAWVDPPGAWVHGGNPVLFPQAGTLAHNRFADAGTALLPHGVVYGRRWSLDLHWASRVTCSIASDETTRRAFPFSWYLAQEVVVGPRTLRCTLRVTNTGPDPLPVAPGWHPYFAVPLGEKEQVRIDGVQGFRPPPSPDVEIDDVLPLPRSAPLDVRWPSGAVRLTTSPHFHTLVVWTMPGQPFICVEPWVASPDALNDPARRLTVAAGATLSLWMEIARVPAS
ncbi:MAG: hypothetical protein NVSMB65_05970 [Chloroflexota bacterium]